MYTYMGDNSSYILDVFINNKISPKRETTLISYDALKQYILG